MLREELLKAWWKLSKIPGIGRVTEEEYQEDKYRMENGLLSYGDTGAWRDAARTRRSLD